MHRLNIALVNGMRMTPRSAVAFRKPVSSFSVCSKRMTFAPFNQQIRFCSTESKKMEEIIFDENAPATPKVKKLVAEVAQLNLLEMVQFTKEMSKVMGIDINQVMAGPVPAASAAAPAPAAAAPAEEKKEEKAAPAKSTVTIKLTKVDEGNKYKVLKEIRALKPGMNLAESKALVEATPSVLKEGVPRDEALKWIEKIKAAGGEAALE